MNLAPISDPLQDPHNPKNPLLSTRTVGILAVGLFVIAAGAVIFEYVQTPAPKTQVAAAASIDAFNSISLIAKSAVVIDITSGQVLYAKNAETQLPLASLTKVATALAVSEVLRMDDIITIENDASSGSSAGAPRERFICLTRRPGRARAARAKLVWTLAR